jgi:WD40 repeat protein
LSAKKDVSTFRKHSSPVVGVTFTPSGLRTLSLDRDLGTLIWDVSGWLK